MYAYSTDGNECLPCANEGQLDCDDEDADSANYCSAGYYLDSSTATCTLCDRSCKTCNASGPLACTTCWDDSTLDNYGDGLGDGEGLDD